MDIFESIQGPLKVKLVDLVQKLSETESDLESANRALKKKDDALEKLASLKKEADDTVDVLKLEVDDMKREKEVEIADVKESMERLIEENVQLKIGEGVDAKCFAPLKDLILDSTGEELVQQIKKVHLNLDLSFLTDDGTDTGVDPILKESKADRSLTDSTIEGGSA